MDEIQEKSYSQKEVDALIQSECDKVRTQYSKKVKELDEEIKGLKPTEKSETEIALEKRIAEVEAQERSLAVKAKQLDLTSKLSSLGLDKGLADYLNPEADLDQLVSMLQKQTAFVPLQHAPTQELTKNEFDNLTYSERVKFKDSNPSLFERLFQSK